MTAFTVVCSMLPVLLQLEAVSLLCNKDILPDVGLPPDSHWPTEKAPDDGGSLPRPLA